MLSIGRQGQLYVVAESTFGTTPTLEATHALRHKSWTPTGDPTNRRTILEKKQSPGHTTAQRTNQRKLAAGTLAAILRPSGTINTLPECSAILEAAFGAKTNTSLSTTVGVGTGAVGGATLASGTGLAKHDALLIVCPDGKKRVRFITAVNPGTGVVTWAPNLPAAPADGAAVKAAPTYKLTTLLTKSLSAAHYLKKTNGDAGLKRVLEGWVIDSLGLMFDANDEPMLSASGPAQVLSEAPAQPGGFTMVGGQPPSGLIGELLIGNTAMPFLKLGIDLKNNLILRLEDYGVAEASEVFRQGRRDISVTIDARLEDEATLYDLTEAGTNTGVFKQTGYTEGNIVALRAPAVEFKQPDVDDPDEVVNSPFKGMALESADSENDELVIAIA